jgi:hypothetical protein
MQPPGNSAPSFRIWEPLDSGPLQQGLLWAIARLEGPLSPLKSRSWQPITGGPRTTGVDPERDHGNTLPTPYGCPLQTPGSVDSPRGREGGEAGSSDSEADGTANWERQHPEDTEIATSTAAPPGNRLAARDIGRLIEPGLASPTFFAIVPPTILEFRR